MTTKVRYIPEPSVSRVVRALRSAGYPDATIHRAGDYAINVAARLDPHDTPRVHAIIDTALDGYTLDSEGYAYDASDR